MVGVVNMESQRVPRVIQAGSPEQGLSGKMQRTPQAGKG